MSDPRFEQFLARAIGLNAASIGPSAIERAVAARSKACKLDDIQAYWELLQNSEEETQELIEAVIVPETWFFRDPQAFAALTRLVTRGPLQADASRPIRLLSLPCSSGEEPYTMAMALLDAGLTAAQFRIDAVDLSARSLALARQGIYGRNSFRGQNLAFRDRYFDATDDGYRLRDTVRGLVQFSQGNIVAPDFYADPASYDFVFCRNLLIYFDAATQKHVVGVIRRLLAPHGVAFVGHSEAGLMGSNGFTSAKIPMAFAFHKESVRPGPAKARPAPPPAEPRPRRAPPPSPTPRPIPPAFPRREEKREPAPPNLEELRLLADRGQLQEAARGCETLIRRDGATPDALALLGLISDASNDLGAAERYYRKALYLDPANTEALGHLALLLKKQGDHSGAKLLDERLRRLDKWRAQ
ncbi:methyltransferase [Labrys sp. LIt4]|uniref:CheR family methyltransferase n=1 Tax=Labrys sp. LIt4 TaxID=2821355 RepID=UPI001ADF441B|nr:CheR family methyltransferase [Labrys sp. LIt4]MBP0580310.1 methyltransferase [Labrys sp. LIt4]